MEAPASIAPRTGTILAALIACTAAFFIAATAWQLVVAGPFAWHVTRAESWQGALEGLVLAALLALGLARNSTASLLALVLLPAAIYLRRHAVDLPLIVDGLYVETLFALGTLGRRCSAATPAATTRDWLHAFVLGVCLWSVAAWTASAFGFGGVAELRWLTLALGAIAFAFRPRLFTMHLWQRVRTGTCDARVAAGVLGAWGLVLYAKAGLSHAYDSLWYPLRPEYVLVAGGSAFRSLGLVSPVYYFPKLYEMVLTPLAGLGNVAVMNGLGIWLLLMIGLACADLLRELGAQARTCRIGAGLCVTLPAVCNIASSEAKPDTLALLLMLLALLECIRYQRTHDRTHLVGFATCALLATQTKLTSIPYVGALVVVLVWQLQRNPQPRAISNPKSPALIAFGCAAIVAAFVTARTWLLTGMPTIGPDPLFALWRALGMTLSAPVGTLQWTRPPIWSDVPELLVDELFRPQKLHHVAITWLGNAWLMLGAFVVPNARPQPETSRHDRPASFGIALMITGLGLLVACRYQERGSDGNYFAIAALAATIWSVAAAFRRFGDDRLAVRALTTSAIALALFQAGYAFVSAAWSPGTRAFDLDLSRGFHRDRQQRQLDFRQAGLAGIVERLRHAPRVPRVVGYVSPDTLGFELPFTFEDLRMISFSHPEYFASTGALVGFLRAADVGAIILPRDGAPAQARDGAAQVVPLLREIETMPGIHYFDDANYTLLDLSQSSLSDAQRKDLAERGPTAPQPSCAGWASRYECAPGERASDAGEITSR